MARSAVAGGVFEWEVPDHRAAGWLNTSAPFGLPGAHSAREGPAAGGLPGQRLLHPAHRRRVADAGHLLALREQHPPHGRGSLAQGG